MSAIYLGLKVHAAYNSPYMQIRCLDDGSFDKSTPIPVPHWKRQHADWMPTCFTSKDMGIEMCHLMPLDLDYLGTQECWKKSGKLDHLKIKKLIKKELPDVYKGFFLATLISTGGQGLCLLLKLAPFDIDRKSNKTTTEAFLHSQNLLINFFRKRGINADYAAMGVKRQCINYYNQKRRLYYNHEIHAQVQKEYEEQCKLFKAATARQRAARKWSGKKLSPLARIRLAVEQASSNPTRVPKKYDLGRLHHNQKTQLQIAELLKLLKLNKVGRTTHRLTFTDLCEWTELSEYKVTQLVKNKAHTSHYLVFNKLKDGSYEVVCELSKELVSLIDRLCSPTVVEETGVSASEGISYSLAHQEPEKVQSGCRHSYLSALVLLLKLKGYSKSDAERVMDEVAPRIKDSKNAKYVRNKVNGFYKRKLELVGIRPLIMLPLWLESVIRGLDLSHTASLHPLMQTGLATEFGVVDKCQEQNSELSNHGVKKEFTQDFYTSEQFTGDSLEAQKQARSSFQPSQSFDISNLIFLKNEDSSGAIVQSIYNAEAKPRLALNLNLEKGGSEKENLNNSLKKAAAQAAKPLGPKAVKVSVDGYFLYRGNYYSTPKYTPKFCDIRDIGNGAIELVAKSKTVCTHLMKFGKGHWITDPTHEQAANYKGLEWVADSAAKERGCEPRSLYAELIKGTMEERSRKLRRLWKSKFLTLLDEFESYKGSENIPESLQVVGMLRELGMTKANLRPARGYVDNWLQFFKQLSSYGTGVDGLNCFILDLIEENQGMLKKPLVYWDQKIQNRMRNRFKA